MKKIIVLIFVLCSVLYSQTNTIHIEVKHEMCGDDPVLLYSGDFEEGDTFTFAGATLPLTLVEWQSYYDMYVGAGLTFPDGSLDNHVEVYVTIGKVDCDNPGLYSDPTGQGFQIFMFIDITVYLNGEPIHMDFPPGTEPTLTFDNMKILNLLSSLGIYNLNNISFGYYDGGTFTTDGITINVGISTTTLTLSHFSQFGGGVGNIFTDVEDEEILPTEYSLSQNYPNPFNPTTQINYSLPESGIVKLTVYDTMGRQVATLVDEEMPAGNHTTEFNAEGLSSGFYVYKLQIGGTLIAKKMMLLK